MKETASQSNKETENNTTVSDNDAAKTSTDAAAANDAAKTSTDAAAANDAAKASTDAAAANDTAAKASADDNITLADTDDEESDVQTGVMDNNADATWSFKDGVLTISGTGETEYFGNNQASPVWHSYYLNNQVTSVVIEDGITKIGDAAFIKFTNLKTVTLADSVTEIGQWAFQGCTSLESINLPDTDDFTIYSLGDLCFEDCTSLKNITMSDTMKESIESDSTNMYELFWATPWYVLKTAEEATVGTNEVSCKYGAWKAYCFTPSESGDYAIYIDSASETDTLSVFDEEGNLLQSEKSGTGNIGSFVFTLEAGKKCYFRVGYVYDHNTDNVVIEKVDDSAVYYQYNSTTKTLTIKGNGNLEDSAIFDSYDNRKAAIKDNDIEHVVIEDSVTGTIPASLFLNCYYLESIVIGDGITAIGENAFECSNFANGDIDITLGDGIKTIGESAFFRYHDNINVTFGKSTTTVGATSFSTYGNVSVTFTDDPSNITFSDEYSISGDKISFYFNCDCADLWDVNPICNKTSAYYKIKHVDGCDCETNPKLIATISLGDDAGEYSIYTDGRLVFSGGSPSRTSNTDAWYMLRAMTETVEFAKDVSEVPSYCMKGFTDLKKVIFDEGVEEVGNYAFEDCTQLEKVIVSSTVKSMEYAFGGYYGKCTKLTSLGPVGSGAAIEVNFGTEVPEDFMNCMKTLQTVELPETIESIGGDAFCNCEALQSIKLPETLQTIGSSAFYNCSSLQSINLPESLQTIGSSAFYNCSALNVTLPSQNLTSIGYSAFRNCTSMTLTEIPESVTTIESSAFMNCPLITKVTIPGTVTTIRSKAFGYLDSSSKVEGFTIVGYKGTAAYTYATYTYGTYEDNTFITFEQNPVVGIIGKGSCGDDITYTLTSDGKMTITGTGAMTDYAKSWSYGQEISTTPWYALREYIESVEISEDITTVGAYAFYGASSLKQITLPEALTSIGTYAFYGSGLESVAVPAGVKEIGTYAFSNCTALASADFTGCSDLTVNSNAFGSDSALTTVTGVSGMGYVDSGAFTGTAWYTDYSANGYDENGCLIIGKTMFGCNYTGEVLTVSEGVEYISGYAILGANTTLTTLYLPKSLKSVSAFAFFDCINLGKVYTWAECTSIGQMAFGWYEYSDFYSDGKGYCQQGLTIYGIPGSEAESYCTRSYTTDWGYTQWTNNFTFVDRTKIYLTEVGKLSLSKTEYSYTGKAIKPTVTVEVDDEPLTQGTDYTVSYSDNVNVGWCTVTVTGKGSYAGTLSTGFRIKGVSQNVTVKASALTVGGTGKITVSGAQGKISYYSYSSVVTVSSDGKLTANGVGTASVHIYVGNSGKYEAYSTNITVKVVPKAPVISKVIVNTTATAGMKITWGAASGATGYYVYRSVNGGSYTKVGTTSSTSYLDKKATTNGAKYAYKIFAYAQSSTYKSAASSAKYGYYLKKPAISSVTAGSKCMTVKWKKVTSVTGYQIQYATNSSFKSAKTVTVKGYTTVSKKISSLTSKKKYYVRIRTYKASTSYYSNWSAAKTVTVK